jgi:hypothetical protein
MKRTTGVLAFVFLHLFWLNHAMALEIVPQDPADKVTWEFADDGALEIRVKDPSGIGRAILRGIPDLPQPPVIRFLLSTKEVESFSWQSGDQKWEGSRKDPAAFVIRGEPGAFVVEIPAAISKQAGAEVSVQWIDYFR